MASPNVTFHTGGCYFEGGSLILRSVVKTLVVIIGILLFTSGTSASFNDQCLSNITRIYLPPELRQIMDKNREMTFPPIHPDLEDTLNSFVMIDMDREEHTRVFEILRQIRIRHDRPDLRRTFMTADLNVFLTHEQIREEIGFFFDLLRHGYDGYLYFGGDNVFLPVRDAMLERLVDMADPLQVSSYLNDLIVPAMQGVVADNHFWIHHTRFGPLAYMPYMNDRFILRKGEDGFTTKIDGGLYRVLEVVELPSSFVDGIMPTLTSEGEVAWVFGLVTAYIWQNTVEIKVLFENIVTGERHYRIVDLERVDSPRLPIYPALVKREVEGVMVMENRNLLNPEEDEVFLLSGYELRDRQILVMDLRGHIGGGSMLPSLWIEMYTGQRPQRNSLFAVSSLQRLRVPVELINFFVPLNEVMRFDRHMESVMDRHPRFASMRGANDTVPDPLHLITSVPSIPLPTSIPNENFIIVLIDKNVVSAGELFVGHLRQLENVLVVGTNTSGSFFSGGVGRTILPYSGLPVIFGTQLHLRHDLTRFEGIGFMPDLWVPPQESLERVLRFIERYGLAR